MDRGFGDALIYMFLGSGLIVGLLLGAAIVGVCWWIWG